MSLDTGNHFREEPFAKGSDFDRFLTQHGQTSSVGWTCLFREGLRFLAFFFPKIVSRDFMEPLIEKCQKWKPKCRKQRDFPILGGSFGKAQTKRRFTTEMVLCHLATQTLASERSGACCESSSGLLPTNLN